MTPSLPAVFQCIRSPFTMKFFRGEPVQNKGPLSSLWVKYVVIYTWQIPCFKTYLCASKNEGNRSGINVEINLGLSTYQSADKLMKFNSYVLFRQNGHLWWLASPRQSDSRAITLQLRTLSTESISKRRAKLEKYKLTSTCQGDGDSTMNVHRHSSLNPITKTSSRSWR